VNLLCAFRKSEISGCQDKSFFLSPKRSISAESNPLSTQEQRARLLHGGIKVFFHRHRFTTRLKTLRVECSLRVRATAHRFCLFGSQNFSPVGVGTICRHFFSEVYNIWSGHWQRRMVSVVWFHFRQVFIAFLFYIWPMGAFVFL
jgi:hypothetical protein